MIFACVAVMNIATKTRRHEDSLANKSSCRSCLRGKVSGPAMKHSFAFIVAVVIGSTLALAQGPLVQVCTDKSTPACAAVRGDRSEGWLQQTRSEVMARNGIVTTVQPLAAQAGLRILQDGGNAIDAAVAAAAMLNVVYPANTGIGEIGRAHV